MKKFIEDIKTLKFGLLFAFIYFITMQSIFHNICITKILFDIDCPMCGLTRAGLSLIKLNFKQAYNYNPNIFLWILFIILFIYDRYIKKLKINIFPLIFIIVTIINIIWFIFIKIPKIVF